MNTQVSGPIDLYARVSRLKRGKRNQDERERSPEGQVAACRGVLADRGLDEGEVLVDPGLSAWNPKVIRKAWDKLMLRLETGQSGGFCVFDLERFSRQPEDGERLIKLAARGLLILDSESQYDLTTPNGRKAFRDAMNAAAYYSDRLSTRTARGKRLKAMAGEPNGSARPFGFEADLVTKRESEAVVLRDHTRRFLAGEAQDNLIAELNDRGVWTSYGKPWTRAGLRQVLTRPRNCGRIEYRGQIVGRLPGEPIISEEDFDAVVAKYTARRRGRPNSPAYLASGIADCECGRPIYGRPRANVKPYPDGGVNRQYWCPKTSGGCGRIAIDQRALDEAAGVLAVELLSDSRHAAAIEAAAQEHESEALRLEREIADAEGLADELARRLGEGMSLRRYDAAAKPLEERLARLRAERDALGSAPARRPKAVSRTEWKARWAAADQQERRSLLRMALGGRRLVIGPADPSARTDVLRRIRVE